MRKMNPFLGADKSTKYSAIFKKKYLIQFKKYYVLDNTKITCYA